MILPIFLCELDYCGSFEEMHNNSKFFVKYLPDKNIHYFDWVKTKISKMSKKKSLSFLKREIRIHKRKIKRYKRAQKRWWDNYSCRYSFRQLSEELNFLNQKLSCLQKVVRNNGS